MRKIGFFGCMINNDNMGCCALTYSLINLIEQRFKDDKNIYVIFERNPDKKKVADLAEDLCIEKERVISEKSARFIRLYEKSENDYCIKKIKECDVIIDMTQGDSFTDIYGIDRFISYALDKLSVERAGVPLILGPQTYGPYKRVLTEKIARYVINKASFVMSRDDVSRKYLERLKINKEIYVGTDLAVGLPYKKESAKSNSVGVNISGLLWPDKIEEGTKREFTLQCDYKEFMIKTVDYLLKKGYSIYFISHVGADYPACVEMKKIFPEATVVNCFESPVEAKTFISSLELFIGARMHATIAALTSGVPVIPIAYSRKFKGFFENCGYNVGIDLTELQLNECLNMMENYVDSLEIIKNQVSDSRIKALEKHEKMIDRLVEGIVKKGSNKNE